MAIATPANAAAEANRRRYEALRAAGQGATLAALPPKTAPGSAPIPPQCVIAEDEVPGGWYQTMRLGRGEVLRLIDVTGTATPALIARREDDPSERMNLADTVQVQWTAALQRGHVVLSDMGRVMLSVVEDTCGAHDALVGGSVAFGEPPLPRNTRANFIAAVGKLGLDRRDIPAALSLFAPINVGADGHFTWRDGAKAKGDFVDLRAEMTLLLAISNCPHPFQPVAPDAARPLKFVRYRAQDYGGDDPCRRTGAEIGRAFAFTNRLFA